ncbi:MAG: amidase family protein, partial [Pseudomonadota bacterium]
ATLAAPSSAPQDITTTGLPFMNTLATFAGMPAISLPLLEVHGMPLGLQLIAPRGNDDALLAAAAWFMEDSPAVTTKSS